MKFIYIVLFFGLFSCENPETVEKKSPSKIITSTSKEDSIRELKKKRRYEQRKKASELNRKGRKELEEAIIKEKITTQFPFCEYSKILLYKLNGNGNHSRAESVFRQRTSEFKEMRAEEISDFIQLINTKESYGNSTAACHEPRIGLVFYDKNGQACSYLSLCLTCNNIYTKPEIKLGLEPGQTAGFSLKSRKKLYDILEKWDFPYTEYSELFDDEERLNQFLKEQGISIDETRTEDEIDR